MTKNTVGIILMVGAAVFGGAAAHADRIEIPPALMSEVQDVVHVDTYAPATSLRPKARNDFEKSGITRLAGKLTRNKPETDSCEAVESKMGTVLMPLARMLISEYDLEFSYAFEVVGELLVDPNAYELTPAIRAELMKHQEEMLAVMVDYIADGCME